MSQALFNEQTRELVGLGRGGQPQVAEDEADNEDEGEGSDSESEGSESKGDDDSSSSPSQDDDGQPVGNDDSSSTSSSDDHGISSKVRAEIAKLNEEKDLLGDIPKVFKESITAELDEAEGADDDEDAEERLENAKEWLQSAKRAEELKRAFDERGEKEWTGQIVGFGMLLKTPKQANEKLDKIEANLLRDKKAATAGQEEQGRLLASIGATHKLIAKDYPQGDKIKAGGQGAIYHVTNKPFVKKTGNDLREEAVALQKAGPHKNIVAFQGIIEGKTADDDAIILEYIDGEELHQMAPRLLKDADKAPVDAAKYLTAVLSSIKEACAGVEHLAKSGVVHNDLNPRNLMVDKKTGVTKIIDFGTAREPGCKFAKEKVKTAGYTDEDQVADGNCSEKSDVYSLGCMLDKDCAKGLGIVLQTKGTDFDEVKKILEKVNLLSVKCCGKVADRPSAAELAVHLQEILSKLNSVV